MILRNFVPVISSHTSRSDSATGASGASAGGQHVQHETIEELRRGQLHDPAAITPSPVAPAEAHVVVVVQAEQAMLDEAAARGTTRPVEWRQADAMQLPFPDASFDGATVGFGVRNLADLEAGLRERIPDFVLLPNDRQLKQIRRVAHLDVEFAREAIISVGASDVVQTAIGSTRRQRGTHPSSPTISVSTVAYHSNVNSRAVARNANAAACGSRSMPSGCCSRR